MTLAAMLAGPAFAQCAPDPTVVNGTTTCTGTDSDGLTVTTFGTRVVVGQNAIVKGSGGPAVAIRIASANGDNYGTPVSMNVAGLVDGGSDAGVSLLWQPIANNYATQSLALTVAQGGRVTGVNGIVVGQAATGYGNASVTIDNGGTITGTGGVALLSTAPSYAGFSSITNRAGGTIGAIVGPVGTLNNAGTIDGGTLSAIDLGTVNSGAFSGAFTNSGTITANGSIATLANLRSGRTLTNSGVIANRGTGVAIAGEQLDIVNLAAGRITSAGSVAIRANTSLQLINAGTITGNIVTAAAPAYPDYPVGSTIDSSAGTIAGSVTFGSGADTLVAGYAAGRLVTGITGAIDGGAGIDTVRVVLTADTSFAGALALPVNFERFAIAPNAQVTATLASGFSAPGTLLIGGSGTTINRTTLTAATQVIAQDYFYLPTGNPVFENAGTIATTAGAAGTAAVNLVTVNRFLNSGTVTASGDGVNFSSQGSFVNTGSIVATGTGVSLFGPSFANSGAIRSTAGIGVTLNGSSGANWTNSGRIEGVTAGARISSSLTNSGIITGTQTGVILDPYGVLDNRAGGVVTGGTTAIGPQNSNGMFNATIANAGTINGNVVLTSGPFSSYSTNRFFALPGGVVNGNLTLGSGDTLVTELVNNGPGAFAGITGTVTASNSVLRYRVRQATTAALAAPSGFTRVGYDLFDQAALTLTGNSSGTLSFAGRGTVDLSGDVAATTQPAITSDFLPGETMSQTNALAITSRGALSLTRTDANTYPGAVVALGGSDSFVNAGTITAIDRVANTGTPYIAAITGGSANSGDTGTRVTNDGTITLDGTIGISGAARVTNTGSIVQAAGGRAASGVRSLGTLVNTGTIDVGGIAVLGSYYSFNVDNSGRIASSGDIAIALDSYGSAVIVNRVGGTIAGATGKMAIRTGGGTLTNAGTITGTVDLGYSTYGRSYSSATYTADGGTIAGDLLFGDGMDTFVTYGDTGVSGKIDGGQGIDTLLHASRASATVTLGGPNLINFEREGVLANGLDTVVTIRADAPFTGDVVLSGDGSVVNTATIDGIVQAQSYFPANGPATILAGFTNQATIARFQGTTRSFTNSGTISGTNKNLRPVSIDTLDTLSFRNEGDIRSGGSTNAAALFSSAAAQVTAANTGTIAGGLSARLQRYDYPGSGVGGPATIALDNSGTISTSLSDRSAVQLATSLTTYYGQGSSSDSITLANSGTIEASGIGGTGAYLATYGTSNTRSIDVTNSGTIRANAGGHEVVGSYYPGYDYRYTAPATALLLTSSDIGTTVTVTNTATGTIEATGDYSSAIFVGDAALDLVNAGAIRGSAGSVLTSEDGFSQYSEQTYLAGAIQSTGDYADRIANTGSIIGSIDLGDGDDRIDNLGRIDGNVFLGAGNDIFLQRASGSMIGTVDAGAGDDLFIVDATGGGSVNGDQFINFERFSQIGEGSVAYSGNFRFNTVDVAGGTITVGAGQTLSSEGATTISGTDAGETVVNDGTIAGTVALGAGNDRVVNRGTIGGSVLLGDGDDAFVEGAGSKVAGTVDGGNGIDTYTALLSGDRTGLAAHTGFERLGVEGNGTLTLTLDRNYEAVSLAGTGTGAGLNVTLAGYTIGRATGSDGIDRFATDGDIASASLGGGNDVLTLGAPVARGSYAGGAGNDLLRFTATGPVVLAGTATGFEQLELAGNALTIAGTLGSAGAPLAFDGGDQRVTVANGGTLAGIVDLGAGNDVFRLSATGTLAGTVSGGAGTDAAFVELAGDRSLAAILSNFETLTTEGTGTLTLTGTQGYGRFVSAGDLVVAGAGSLAAGQVQFGAGNQRFTIAGGFASSVDGGAGTDTILLSGQLSGGNAAAPVAFANVANVEALAMTGGYATVSGTAAFGTVDMSGGRLVGLSGSTIGATQFTVRPGATFGSAGTVNGNVSVAGTLSPGASPGTMTVNGNVALAAGSLSLFELTPTVSDKLVVNGTLTIAQGATLQLVPVGTLRAGTSYDLITASGGITGSYTTVLKPEGLFGVIVQRADRIQLLGQFLGDARFSPQVSRSIAYANSALQVQSATSPLFAALPALLTTGGASNPQAFAQLTPEAYASAMQIGVDNALTLTEIARSPAFGAGRTTPGGFTFAQGVGNWYRLGADDAQGTAATRTNSYGFVGGVGYGDIGWSVGLFGGYLDSHQRIDALGARTDADGFVAGVHGRYQAGGFGLSASILYNGAKGDTERALPGMAAGTRGAIGRYDLNSWVGDVSVGYAIDVGTGWALKPRAGITYVRTTRDGVAETGGVFALSVARDRHVAGFADGGIGFAHSETSDAAFRPFVGLGVRYQIEGRRADALAGYSGAPLGLEAFGAQRARAVATASAGIVYRAGPNLDLFSTVSAQSGQHDNRENVSTGVKLRF